MLNLHSLLAFIAGTMAVAYSGTALAQSYPSKPIRIITTPAGSGSDITSRVLAQAITGPLGQPVVIENRGGAGVVQGQALQQAVPDGYTVVYSGSALWNGALLIRSTPYDPIRDFSPIIQTIRQPGLLVVPASLGVNSVKELVAMIRARPGTFNYATVTSGSLNHLGAEMFQSMAGVEVQRIDYKGGEQMVQDVIAGRVQLLFGSLNLVYPHARSGKVKGLAVTTARSTDLMPGIAPIGETLPGYEFVSNEGLFAPARTPAAIVGRLNQEVGRVLLRPDVKEKLSAVGSEPVGGTPEQFASLIKADMERLARLIKERNIPVND